MALASSTEPDRLRSDRGGADIAVLLAVLVAMSATLFGVGFAREGHGHAAGEHAESSEHGETEEAEAGRHAEEDDDDVSAGAIASSVLISLGGVALVPLALVSVRRAPVRAPDLSTVPGAGAVVVALLSIGAAVIHFAVVAQHFDEWWLTGSFFVGIALFQLAWGLLVLTRPSARVFALGAIANALVVVTWIVSRTSGVPVGPGAGEAEVVGAPDLLATAFEVVLVLVCTASVFGRAPRLPARADVGVVRASLAALVVASLTALALVLIA